MCGENPFLRLFALAFAGSPPHVRGKLTNVTIRIERNRITPACARKTRGQTPSKNGDKDHPRMCGENPLF